MATSHPYRTTCSWSGSTADGYRAYARTHLAASPPAAARIVLSADPAFGGDPGLLNPEQLVVVAASSCQLLSFLALAARARVDVVGYEDEATAELVLEGDPPARLGTIRLRPRITVSGKADEARLLRLVRLAHEQCYVANSLRTEVHVEATIIEQAPGARAGGGDGAEVEGTGE